jgi:uncharacterized membrane protein YkvA (DUF1232 family)
MGGLAGWRERARRLETEVYALYLAARDPRTPGHARLLAALVLAYALSPIDLIPDFVPVLGLLDDLVLVPLGIWLVVRLVPPAVLADARARAAADSARPTGRRTAVLVTWAVAVLVLAAVAAAVARRVGG